jgi:CRISPR/Cas system-associated exonuclease Cas4 (RecB family)
MGTVSTLPAGGSALDVLGRRLGELRGGAVLAPAVVLCATPVMAISLRRALAARVGGIAGVRFTTVDAFAAELAQPALLADRMRPARKAEVLAAIRAELRAAPGRFGPVADHRTTEDRLAAFHQELVGLPDEVLDRLQAASGGLSTDALRVVRGASARLGGPGGARPAPGRGGDDDGRRACGGDRLLALALARLEDAEPLASGPLVLYCPEPARPYEGRLVQALARRPDCEVLVALTGVAAVDEGHLRRLAGWSVQVGDDARLDRPETGSATVLEVPDPEEEVRAALREVTAHAATGVPLTELAVLHTSVEPYANLLADQLEATGLPWCGPGHRGLGASLAGRTLRRLLALAARGLEREAVITLLAAAPIDDGSGREVPAPLWDQLSRQAGVIDGDHWIPRLAELAGGAEDDDAKRSTVALADFVEELAAGLRPPGERTWTAWSGWAAGLLDRYLLVEDRDGSAGAWPAAELRALERLDQLLIRLADLDDLGLPPTLATFEATVLAELAGEVIPGVPLGTGVYVGPIDSVPGLGFERIIVVGLAEGSFPRTPREDSLLPDQLRAAGAGMLIEKAAVTDIDIRMVGLAAASSRRPAVLLTARGDLRSNRSRTWPRVLDPLVGGRQSLASHYEGLVGHGRPACAEDFGLRSLIEHVDNDDPIQTHELAAADPVLAANLRRIDNRARTELTAHAGGVPAGRFDPTERLLSPTALETYAACPRKYLFQRVLRLGEDERPERIDEITARDRGTLLHRILERFIADALVDEDVPEPGQPWPPERRGHLFDLLDQEVKIAEARGITGGLVKTRLLRQSLANELLDFLDRDDELRAERRSTPHAAEFAFGQRGNPALEGSWAGHRMQLRGTVDRIDTTADGGLLVIDYKGGSKRPFEGMEDNPLDDGRRLQLPLYARVVAERLGLGGPRTGLYWLTRANEVREMVLDDRLEADLERAVGAALEGIGRGRFPGVPGEVVGWPRLSFENCRYCDFDRICPTDRQSEWERVRADRSLEPIEVLLGSFADEADEADGADGADEADPTDRVVRADEVPDGS